MGITDFEFKVMGILEEKMTKYKNSIPRKAVIDMVNKIFGAYNSIHIRGQLPPDIALKVGDLLYEIYYDKVTRKFEVDDEPRKVNEIGTKYFFLSDGCINPWEPNDYYSYDALWTSFFRTREEAEEKARKLNEQYKYI